MRQNGVRPARFRFNKGGRAGAMGGGKMISGKQRKMKHLVFIHLIWE